MAPEASEGREKPGAGAAKPGETNPDRPSPAELYRRAEALIPTLAGRAEACERLRHCPPETIDDLAGAGLLQICRPARFGGFEYGWDVLSEVNRILARGCGSQAWVANVLNDHTQLVGAFPPEAQEEIWGANPATRIAASVAPRARRGAPRAAPGSPAAMALPAASIMSSG